MLNLAWLVHWKCLAITLGTFFEGEATLLAAGALSQRDFVAMPLVVLSGCAGSLAWSQFWYRAGRRFGAAIIDERPAWREKCLQAQRGIARYGLVYALAARFVLGMGTVAPAVFGVARFPARRFLALDVLGSMLWAAAVSCVGWALSSGFCLLPWGSAK